MGWAGRLRHKIQIQANVGTAGSDGHRARQWQNITDGDVRAEIKPVRGRELQTVGQIQADTGYLILIRHSSEVADIDASHRILWGTRKFAITAPPRNIGERDRWIEIEASEGIEDDE